MSYFVAHLLDSLLKQLRFIPIRFGFLKLMSPRRNITKTARIFIYCKLMFRLLINFIKKNKKRL